MRSSSSDFLAKVPEIPDHEMIRQIGKGSYGEVWLGRSVTGALRAIKVVSRADFEHDRTFEREFEGIKSFEPISRSHPGLVNVLHIGRNLSEGFYYYVMELADDRLSGCDIVPELYVPRTLSSEIKERGKLSMNECSEWGAVMADALHHMHKSGLAHRDVKPSNVIFVDGFPKLADIGLVAASGQRTFVGTEGFVPPEGPGEPRADIYSLGMVLYEMSTGKDRFDFPAVSSPQGDEMERKKWRRLNTIVCKACAPSVKQRYGNAHEMWQSLRALNSGLSDSLSFSAKLFRVIVFSGLLAATIVSIRNFDLFRAYYFNNEIVIVDPIKEPFVQPLIKDPDESVVLPLPSEEKEKFGSIRITSIPRGAKVFHVSKGGKKIFKGVTSPDYFESEVMPSEVAFELKFDGYRVKAVRGIVKAGQTLVLGGRLEFYNPPTEGSNWENSLGMIFTPTDGGHVAGRPFSLVEFEGFIADREEEVDYHKAEVVLAADPLAVTCPTALVNRQLAADFLNWMTAKERGSGHLAENQHYVLNVDVPHEKIEVVYGKDVFEERFPLVASVQKSNLTKLLLDSDPQGASVFINNEYQGTTSVEVSQLRPGPIEIVFRLAGHRNEIRHLELQPGLDHPVSVKMRESDGVVFGKRWTNSLGIPMLPLRKNIMMAAWETRVKDFESFYLAKKREYTQKPRFTQGPNHPVVLVGRKDMVEFCEWLTEHERTEGLIGFNQQYGLPSDRDWSIAAGLETEQGSSPAQRDRPIKGVFPWGKEWPPKPGIANVADSSARIWLPKERLLDAYQDNFAYTAPVGSFRPNEKGFFDLAGNVWEWVNDSYGGNSSFKDWAVARGGGYDSSLEEHFLTSYRNVQPPEEGGAICGFRIILSLKAEDTEE